MQVSFAIGINEVGEPIVHTIWIPITHTKHK